MFKLIYIKKSIVYISKILYKSDIVLIKYDGNLTVTRL